MNLNKIFKKINKLTRFLRPKNNLFFYLDNKNTIKKLYLSNKKYFNKNVYKNTEQVNFNIEILKKKIKKYELIVISNDINYLSNKKIKEILDLLIKNKKKIIIEGNSCYLNLNIDNYCNWFRPIDITKKPFNYKHAKILYNNLSMKFLIQYLIFITVVIFIISRNNTNLSVYLFIFSILIVLFIPFKKIIMIKNT